MQNARIFIEGVPLNDVMDKQRGDELRRAVKGNHSLYNKPIDRLKDELLTKKGRRNAASPVHILSKREVKLVNLKKIAENHSTFQEQVVSILFSGHPVTIREVLNCVTADPTKPKVRAEVYKYVKSPVFEQDFRHSVTPTHGHPVTYVWTGSKMSVESIMELRDQCVAEQRAERNNKKPKYKRGAYARSEPIDTESTETQENDTINQQKHVAPPEPDKQKVQEKEPVEEVVEGVVHDIEGLPEVVKFLQTCKKNGIHATITLSV